MAKFGYVYILASRKHGTLYIGVTNNLMRRAEEHKSDIGRRFTKRYQVHRLVYYEFYDEIETAIEREKRLKRWNRSWKIALIERVTLIGKISRRISSKLKLSWILNQVEDDYYRGLWYYNLNNFFLIPLVWSN